MGKKAQGSAGGGGGGGPIGKGKGGKNKGEKTNEQKKVKNSDLDLESVFHRFIIFIIYILHNKTLT